MPVRQRSQIQEVLSKVKPSRRLKTTGRNWQFKPRFRRHAFGWKPQPAITTVREAVTEIKQVARMEPVHAAEGAIALIERLSPALEHVDSSSGAIGTAVNRAIAELVRIIAAAPADASTRAAWLERLFEAHGADQTPYIERLADFWGELCGSAAMASDWADRLIDLTRMALSPDKSLYTIKAAEKVGRDEVRVRIRALVDTQQPTKRLVPTSFGGNSGFPRRIDRPMVPRSTSSTARRGSRWTRAVAQRGFCRLRFRRPCQ